MTGDDDGAVGELLIPPALSPEAAAPLPGARTVRLNGETMGTVWSLAAAVPAALADRTIREALEQAFARVIAQMSQWEPDSEISRFNRAPPGTQVPLSAEFAYVLDCALTIARASEGAFDPALGVASDFLGRTVDRARENGDFHDNSGNRKNAAHYAASGQPDPMF